jgi:hypothetical protein
MKPTIVTLAIALALGTLAACDRKLDNRPASAGSSTTPQSANTPGVPANTGTPSAAERKDGSNPVQGQVDTKQPAQHKDLQQKGDGAGPKPGG